MNWEAIGAIGELIGALVVVMSLVYLALQIRSQSRETRLAAMHDVSEGFRDAATSFTDGELADIFVRGNQDFESLSDTEIVRLFALVLRMLRVFEEGFDQHNQGRLEQHIWDAMVRQYTTYLSSGSFRKVWEMRSSHFNSDFQEFVCNLDCTDYLLR